MPKRKVTFEEVLDTAAIISYLDDLKSAIQAGHIVLNDSKNSVELDASGHARFKVQVSLKDGKSKLSLKLSWLDGEEKPIPSIQKLTISSKGLAGNKKKEEESSEPEEKEAEKK